MASGRCLVTPDASLRLSLPPALTPVLPASCFVEQPLPGACVLLPSIWRDAPRARQVAQRSVELSHRLTRAVIEQVRGAADAHLVPLYLDVCNTMVELTLERMLRLVDAGPTEELWPPRVDQVLPRVERGKQYKAAHKGQWFQWSVLRLLAGAPDTIEWRDGSAFTRARNRLARALELRRTPPLRGDGIYRAHLGRYDGWLQRLVPASLPVPDLVQPYALRVDVRQRARLAEIFGALVEPTLREFGLASGGLAAVAQVFAALIPVARLENLNENLARYQRFFEASGVRAYVTATGQGRYDECVFFMAACNRAGRPIVVLQHGGQYGYDDQIPSFFCIDQCLPTHFVSWGWRSYPGGGDTGYQRARIIRLPDPALSVLALQGDAWRPPEGKSTLLVPLSKLRTLDNRLGGNASDGVVGELRRFVEDVLVRTAGRFERILVSHRSGAPEQDPLLRALAGNPTVELVDARSAPVPTLLGQVHAVLWDVTATGMFETIHAGVPTVVFVQRDRWAADAAWAERLLVEAGIAVYTADAATSSLGRFVTEPASWQAARRAAKPALDAYGWASPDCEPLWREFLQDLERP